MTELANFLDDQVAAEVRRELEVHLAQCQTCRALYDSVSKTLKIVTESHTFELPEDISARILDRIMSKIREKESQPPSKRRGNSGKRH